MKKICGFNLIELMMAMSIIGILAYFALPSLMLHFRHEKRLAAEFAIIKAADALEQFHLAHDSYQGASLNALGLDEFIADKNYKLTIKKLTDEEFTLAAIPQNAQRKDTQCGTLLLYSSGKRDITGTGHANQCWQ